MNFIGPEDEYVVSGSDEGNFFMWEKSTGRLHGIYEGDGSIVNVIEGHPRLPLIAVSGIDTTVKVGTKRPAWSSPTDRSSSFILERSCSLLLRALVGSRDSETHRLSWRKM